MDLPKTESLSERSISSEEIKPQDSIKAQEEN
jgi:hypothetical protein